MNPDLDTVWRLRNAAAVTLGLAEDQMRRAIEAAGTDDLVALLESFAPGRSNGPDWARTFEPLVERLWAWREAATMAALAEVFRARGMAWMAVTNALSTDQRAAARHPAWARQPAFTVV